MHLHVVKKPDKKRGNVMLENNEPYAKYDTVMTEGGRGDNKYVS